MMDIKIRQAQPADAEDAAPLIIDAIGDIAKRITGETEWDLVKQGLYEFYLSARTTDTPISIHTLQNLLAKWWASWCYIQVRMPLGSIKT